MKHITTIIGARPQIIKAAAMSRTIRSLFAGKIRETIVHTGQHYDDNMSQVFFDEMGIPEPDHHLGVGSQSHGKQTAAMIEKIEALLVAINPDCVVLYGDTNSTLAGAVAASKIHIPVAHIEAGLRSFNKSMPEEINRIFCDHTSTLLFSPTRTGINNLIREGFNPHVTPPFTIDNPGIFHCGDIMYDNTLFYSDIAEIKSDMLMKLNLEKGGFILGTIHRDNNTDNPVRLNEIFDAILEISEASGLHFVLPLHPRTSKIMKQNLTEKTFKAITSNPLLKIIPPASFFDMLSLEKHCVLVMTDSGGVQKEGYFFKKPVIILRPETEWVEIVEAGAGVITDANKSRIIKAFHELMSGKEISFPPVFGDGKVAAFICKKILEN